MTLSNPIQSTPERLIKLPEVLARVSLSKSSVYEMLGRTPPAFPLPLKLSRRAVCWSDSSITKWIEERIATGGQS